MPPNMTMTPSYNMSLESPPMSLNMSIVFTPHIMFMLSKGQVSNVGQCVTYMVGRCASL